MNRDDLLKLHVDTCNKARNIMEAKNQDYTANGGNDPFANFRASEVIGVHPVIGILMRSMDKFKRIESFVRNGTLAVKAESVDDAIEDVINYMVLAKGMIVEEREKLKPISDPLALREAMLNAEQEADNGAYGGAVDWSLSAGIQDYQQLKNDALKAEAARHACPSCGFGIGHASWCGRERVHHETF